MIMGGIRIACAIFGTTDWVEVGLVIANVLAMMSPLLVFCRHHDGSLDL